MGMDIYDVLLTKRKGDKSISLFGGTYDRRNQPTDGYEFYFICTDKQTNDLKGISGKSVSNLWKTTKKRETSNLSTGLKIWEQTVKNEFKVKKIILDKRQRNRYNSLKKGIIP